VDATNESEYLLLHRQLCCGGPPAGRQKAVTIKHRHVPGVGVKLHIRAAPSGAVVNNGPRDEKVVDEVLRARCTYESAKFGFFVKPGGNWLDGGAHVGTFAAHCWLSGAVSVTCVEPDASNVKFLDQNADALRAAPSAGDEPFHCNVIAAALRPTAAATVFYLHPKGTSYRHTTHGVRDHPTEQQAPWASTFVPGISFQALIASSRFDGVKLDVQSTEIELVDSVTDWGTVHKLVLEYDFEYAPDCADFHAFVKRLRRHFLEIHSSKRVQRKDPWTHRSAQTILFARGRV